jgi:hypothetical protein
VRISSSLRLLMPGPLNSPTTSEYSPFVCNWFVCYESTRDA